MLLRDGAPVPLGQRATSVLEILLQADGSLVSKDVLIRAAWPGVVVEEGNLSVQVAHLRKAIGTTADGQDWIVTVPRVGYRLETGTSATGRVGPPRLAVMPFRNLTGDPARQYLIDGLVEELISVFSRFRSFSVMSRNTATALRGDYGARVSTAQALGVDYILEGSLQALGGDIRLIASLADREGTILWSQSYAGQIENFFDFQSEATRDVAAVIEPNVQRAELQRAQRSRPVNIAAYDLYLQAIALIHAHNADDNARAIELLERAIIMEPGNGTYAGFACWAMEMRTSMGWPRLDTAGPERCVSLAQQAITNAPDDPQVLAHCGLALQLVGREYERGLMIVERALALNPSDPVTQLNCGTAHYLGGSLEAAKEMLHSSIALQPRHAFEAMAVLSMVYSALAQHETALAWARRGIAINHSYQPNHWVAVSALAHLGRLDEARAALTVLLKKEPSLTISKLLLVRPRDTGRDEVVADGMRLAGLPEHS